MAADFTWLISAATLPTRFILPICLALAVWLFSPNRFIDDLGLIAVRQQYHSYLGVAFLFAFCILASRGGESGWKKWQEYSNLRKCRASLHFLTPDEKQVLMGYLQNRTKTRMLSISSGVVAGLTHAAIIYQSSILGKGYDCTIAHNIQPWAWKYLNEKPEILGLTPNDLEEARKRIP